MISSTIICKAKTMIKVKKKAWRNNNKLQKSKWRKKRSKINMISRNCWESEHLMKYKETWVLGSGNQEILWIHCWHSMDPVSFIQSSRVYESPTIWTWIWTKLWIHIFNWINLASIWPQRGKWSLTYYKCWPNLAWNLKHSCETQRSYTSFSSKDTKEVVSIFRLLFLTSHSKRFPASYQHF